METDPGNADEVKGDGEGVDYSAIVLEHGCSKWMFQCSDPCADIGSMDISETR